MDEQQACYELLINAPKLHATVRRMLARGRSPRWIANRMHEQNPRMSAVALGRFKLAVEETARRITCDTAMEKRSS
jgi:hypothetical protein